MKKMNKKGFTLVEMLVVIAIIAILVSILIPTVLGATKKAKAATDAANLRSALAEFEIDLLTTGEDFDTSTGIVAGFVRASGEWTKEVTASKLDGSTTMTIIKDANGALDISYAPGKNIAYYANLSGSNS